jgi:hypothetical protein
MGTAFVHTVLDDHSRGVDAEIHDYETATTAIGVLRRAMESFAERGVTVERVLTANGSAYRSHGRRDACLEPGITPKRAKHALRSPARRHQQLTEEIHDLDDHLTPLVRQAAPQLLAVKGLGPLTCAALLVEGGRPPRTDAQRVRLCTPLRSRP